VKPAHPARDRPAQLAAASQPLDEAEAEELGYDANRAPDGDSWRALSEREQLACVARYHNHVLSDRELPPSLSRHAGLHVIVESQMATGTPAGACAALERLMAEEVSRHDAIHAIGWLAAEHMKRAVEAQVPVDADLYANDLENLTVRKWLQMAGLLRS